VIVGHLALAAMVRRAWPRASLLWLLPASVAPDLLDVCMAVGGVCNPYGLYSHTVPAVVLLAAVVGGAAYLVIARTGAHPNALPTTLGCILVIVLHPLLDFPTGRKLLWPGGALVGLGLYQQPVADFVMESGLVTVGWLLLRRARATPRWASAPAALCALVLLQGAGNFGLRGLKPSACATSETPVP
jgi:hypothetical protein